jgi:RNA polymerase sigma factor (sigma-70 family)
VWTVGSYDLQMGLPSPNAVRGSPDRDLLAEVRELVKDRETAVAQLVRAAASVPHPSLFESLNRVVNKLPAAVSVDLATIRVADRERRLHLVAAVGCPGSEIRTRALSPLEASVVQQMVSHDALGDQASALGFRWFDFAWIGPETDPLGTLLVATRTERRPTADEWALLPSLSNKLHERLLDVDRDSETVRKSALQLAREFEPHEQAAFVNESVAQLRPRERAVLELYADGLSTSEVAGFLVISEHTVRTHVKHALRTLDVRTRVEAADMVRTNQLLQLP